MTVSLIGSLIDAITFVLTTIGIPGLFALMVVALFGLPPIPSEAILPFAGFLVADGTFSLGWVLVAALAGTLVGSYAAYAVGLWWRERITRIGIGHLRLEARHLERVDRFFARRGEVAVGLFRLVPILRAYISYPAGTARMEPVRFGVYTLLGAIPYTVALVWAGMVLRSHWNEVSTYLSFLDIPLLALVALAVAYIALQIAGVLAPGWPPRRARDALPSPAGEAPGRAPPGR